MPDDASSRACLRFGWTALIVFALLGLTLEGLHLIKAPLYLEMRIRRELWTLAHAHGTLLALVTIVFGLFLKNCQDTGAWQSRAATAIRSAALLMPLGFFFGGIGNPETDPSLAILLVPAGALLLVYAAWLAARECWRNPEAVETAAATEKGHKKKNRRQRNR